MASKKAKAVLAIPAGWLPPDQPIEIYACTGDGTAGAGEDLEKKPLAIHSEIRGPGDTEIGGLPAGAVWVKAGSHVALGVAEEEEG